ncbi:DUF4350 domain-containing protein [Rhizobacter sp. J219]|uniref:DUF4350 domain-containing protein n=1 Tax=Rhizobacter sp. J219 TaxID=2898430 RepID=UPI002151288E|nr:DUF4350 domain-containing protein [Rhizobacter sp. J219]MCR5884352.1 DUF4350 domain-containing protein [Rhizobacter sp. J219]
MTETQRTWGLRALIAAMLLGLVAWLASCTEWAEVEVPTPARGEAARNRHYAAQALLRRLGTTVATPENLAQLPPAGATLLLTSWHWDIFPERAQRLRQWVEDGGQLVIFSDNLNQKQLKGWLPVRWLEPPRRQKPRDDEAADAEENEDSDEDDIEAAEPRQMAVLRRLKMPCHDTAEPDSVAPHYAGTARHYKLCGFIYSGWKLQPNGPALWSIDGRDGPLLLRVAKGRGTVTVIQPVGLLDNDRVLQSDNGLAAVAALQARRGSTVWFVTEEARPSLLAWLWQEAAAVVLLAAAALVLALWRGARRFGPLAALAATGRRSMAEQIAGTAQFLRKQGPEALLAAQIRALEAAARSHIRLYDTLDRGQRAAAIAKHTGQDAAALSSALDKSLARKRHDLPATLELLETARRLLVQKKAPHSSSSKKD